MCAHMHIPKHPHLKSFLALHSTCHHLTYYSVLCSCLLTICLYRMWAPWVKSLGLFCSLLYYHCLQESLNVLSAFKLFTDWLSEWMNHLNLHIESPCTDFSMFYPSHLIILYLFYLNFFTTVICSLTYFYCVLPCPIHACMQVIRFRTTILSWIFLKIDGKLTKLMGYQKMESWRKCFSFLTKLEVCIWEEGK